MSKYLILLGLLAVCLLASGCIARGEAMVGAGGVKQKESSATEVEFQGVGGLTLKGTLLRPDGKGPFPALLLLPGSGPTDRDGNQAGYQMNVLKDIAGRLAKEGVASLRFDKRAVAASYKASFPKDVAGLDDFFSWQAFLGDAEAAFNSLKSQQGVDPKNVGILGHSEGGAIALAIAKDVDPSALVLVSTCGRDIGTVIIEQIRQGYGAQFTDKETLTRLVAGAERVVGEIKTTGKVPSDVPAELKPVFPGYLNKYLHDQLLFDPTKAAAAYAGPVLVVQGEKDVQVSAERDAPALMAAIPKGHGELFLVKGASHCLKHPTSPLDPGLTGDTDKGALDKIAQWSKEHLRR